jgi:hypothetical protein
MVAWHPIVLGRARPLAVVLAVAAVLVSSGSASALSLQPSAWNVLTEAKFTNVPVGDREFEWTATQPRPVGADGGYTLGVRMPRDGQPPAGGKAARVGIGTAFNAVQADEMTVRFWVKQGTKPADPPGHVILFVRCAETRQWVNIGRTQIDRGLGAQLQTAKAAITDEDCPSGVVDGLAIVVQGPRDEDDHKWRRVILAAVTLRFGQTTQVETDFSKKP